MAFQRRLSFVDFELPRYRLTPPRITGNLVVPCDDAGSFHDIGCQHQLSDSSYEKSAEEVGLETVLLRLDSDQSECAAKVRPNKKDGR